MYSRALVLSLSLLFMAAPSFGQSMSFDFNKNCIGVYKTLMALDKEAAEKALAQEKKYNTANIIPYYLEDYEDCLELLFNGEQTAYQTLRNNQDKRLALIEKGDHQSPWYRFCKANIYLHWALVNMRFGDNFKAAGKFRKSFLLLHENSKLFPDFEENKVLLGLEEALAGAIPESYQWIAELFGVKGNIKKGIAKIEQYIDKHQYQVSPIQEEAMIYWAYLNFYLCNQPELAWTYINSEHYPTENNLLRSFIKANIALNYRKAKVAEQELLKASAMHNFSSYPILHYEMAEALLMQLNYACNNWYHSFLKGYKGKTFVKDAWLKLAWTAQLHQQSKERELYLSNIKTKGSTQTDADKQALRFAEQGKWPLNTLLEIRLLIDGGQYKQAHQKIEAIAKSTLHSTEEVLEYNFRYGRIFEELHNTEKAILFYDAVIRIGKNSKEYFAARSALQKGFIYEKMGKPGEAIAAYKECLAMRNHDFQSSIDQQAKAGLNRLGQ